MLVNQLGGDFSFNHELSTFIIVNFPEDLKQKIYVDLDSQFFSPWLTSEAKKALLLKQTEVNLAQ